MISAEIYQESPMRGPVFKNVLANIAALAIKQLKGDISIWFPALVVAGNAWRFVQVSQSPRQSTHKGAARFGVMNNTHNRWLWKGTLDHNVSFEYARCQAKHSELKFWMLRSQPKQVR